MARIQRRLQEAKEVKEAEEVDEDEYEEWTCRERCVWIMQVMCFIAVVLIVVGGCIGFTYFLISRI